MSSVLKRKVVKLVKSSDDSANITNNWQECELSDLLKGDVFKMYEPITNELVGDSAWQAIENSKIISEKNDDDISLFVPDTDASRFNWGINAEPYTLDK
jgi:hypothetical protein